MIGFVVCGDREGDSLGLFVWKLLQERVSRMMVTSGSVAWSACFFAALANVTRIGCVVWIALFLQLLHQH